MYQSGEPPTMMSRSCSCFDCICSRCCPPSKDAESNQIARLLDPGPSPRRQTLPSTSKHPVHEPHRPKSNRIGSPFRPKRAWSRCLAYMPSVLLEVHPWKLLSSAGQMARRFVSLGHLKISFGSSACLIGPATEPSQNPSLCRGFMFLRHVEPKPEQSQESLEFKAVAFKRKELLCCLELFDFRILGA